MSDNGAVTRFHIDWISKASALQRAGRAGRTGPGHCYRLFSSAHYNDTFAEHTAPEIVNTPLEQVALSLKSMGVDKVGVVLWCCIEEDCMYQCDPVFIVVHVLTRIACVMFNAHMWSSMHMCDLLNIYLSHTHTGSQLSFPNPTPC